MQQQSHDSQAAFFGRAILITKDSQELFKEKWSPASFLCRE